MADSVAGISLPPGDPGAISDTAARLKRIASGFGRTGDTARAAAASVSWTGAASEAFGARTGDYQAAAHKADAACMRAATALTHFAHRLHDGRVKVRHLQDQAAEAEKRMHTASAEAAKAGDREQAARSKASSMMFSSTLDLTGASMGEQNQALQDADAAAGERAHFQGIADRARDELEQLRKQAQEEREAVKDAATAASGQVGGAQDGLPVVYHGAMYGSAGAMEDRVLARVRAGDYSVLTGGGAHLNTLDEATQRAVGAELAKDADQAAVNKGSHSIQEVGAVVGQLKGDTDFDVGFYNQLGGRGASDFVHNLIFFHGTGDGLHGATLVALMAPFAGALAGATRNSRLRKDFTKGFFREDVPVKDRDTTQLPAFLMAAPAGGYSSKFLADAGRQVLIDPKDPFLNEQGASFYELSDHQDFMSFLAGNPEASGMLLAGHYGPENHFLNTSVLMQYGPRFTDGGDSLNALLQSGTHDLHATNPELANQAAHQVILTAPHWDAGYPDGARPALVTILDDHVVDFQNAATNTYVGNPVHGGVDIDYGQGHDYLKMLFADDSSRAGTSDIVGGQVGREMHLAVSTGNSDHAERAGSLAELSLSASGDADLDSAHAHDTANGLASSAATKLVSLTPPGKVPGVSVVANLGFKELFPQDAVEHGLQQQHVDAMNRLHGFNGMSVKLGVANGSLPHEALDMVNSNGSVVSDFTGGPGSQDVAISHPTALERQFDNNPADGHVSESELYERATAHGDRARDGFLNTWKNAGEH